MTNHEHAEDALTALMDQHLWVGGAGDIEGKAKCARAILTALSAPAAKAPEGNLMVAAFESTREVAQYHVDRESFYEGWEARGKALLAYILAVAEDLKRHPDDTKGDNTAIVLRALADTIKRAR